jgi:hypothetical protein
MDAPTYPPATAFVQPVAVPYEISLRTVPLASLMQMPAAWAIVLKHMPALKMIASTPMIQPHLGNFTVADIAQFAGGLAPELRAKIDEELRSLPAADQVVP